MKIKTAKQLFDEMLEKNIECTSTEMMIAFAKLHRKAILEEIAEDYLYYLEGDEGSERLNKQRFLKEIYPLTNII